MRNKHRERDLRNDNKKVMRRRRRRRRRKKTESVVGVLEREREREKEGVTFFGGVVEREGDLGFSTTKHDTTHPTHHTTPQVEGVVFLWLALGLVLLFLFF